MIKTVNNKSSVLLYWLYTFFIMSIFEIPYLTANVSATNSIYFVLQILSGSTILMLYLKKDKISKINIYNALFCLILLLSTYINNGNIMGCIKQIIMIMTISLLFEYGLKNNTKTFFKSISNYFSLLILINFISILMYPSGMYTTTLNYTDNWILGYRNLHILYIMLGLLFSYLISIIYYKKLRFRDYVLTLISTVSLFIADSGTSKIGILIILVGCILPKILNNRIFNIKSYTIAYIVSCVSIIFLRIQNYFEHLIVDILHRNLTFTGRTYIWDYIIKYINQKPMLGYGKEYIEYRLYKTSHWPSSHAHNLILEILYQSGIIGLISYLIIAYNSFKQLYIYRNSKVSKIISLFIFAYMIMLLTEFYNFEFTIYLFVLGYNVKYLIEGDNNE